MEQLIGYARIVLRRADVANARGRIAARLVVAGLPGEIVGDEQLGPAVAIEIGPGGGRAPSVQGQARLRAHVFETTAAVVAVQPRAAIPGDEQIRKTVAIEIGDRAPVCIARRFGQPRFGRHVDELPIAVVAIQTPERPLISGGDEEMRPPPGKNRSRSSSLS